MFQDLSHYTQGLKLDQLKTARRGAGVYKSQENTTRPTSPTLHTLYTKGHLKENHTRIGRS